MRVPRPGPSVKKYLKMSTVYRYKGGVANYAWDGTKLDALGETITIESITNAEIDAIVSAS